MPSSRAMSSCVLESETVGIVELETGVSGESLVAAGTFGLLEELLGDLERGRVAMLLVLDDRATRWTLSIEFRDTRRACARRRSL